MRPLNSSWVSDLHSVHLFEHNESVLYRDLTRLMCNELLPPEEGEIVAWLLVVTNTFMIGYKSRSTGESSWLTLLTWLKAHSQRSHRHKERTCFFHFLNAHIIKLSSKYLYLSTHSLVLLGVGQRSFFLQWVTVNTETYDCQRHANKSFSNAQP